MKETTKAKRSKIMLKKLFIPWLVSFLAGVSASQAAKIYETGEGLTTVGNCSLKIEGQIEAGDAETVESILKRELGNLNNRRSRGKHPDAERVKSYIVCLSGPGGSYLEGINLGKLFTTYGIATVVPDKMICESACAVAFLGGSACCGANGKSVIQRFLFPGSSIGFHAPSLNLSSTTSFSREAALKAYDLGLEAVARLRQNAEILSINTTFMSKIFEHRGEDFYYIKTLDDAEFNGLLLTGYRARKLKRDTNMAACWNAWNWRVVGPNGFQTKSVETWSTSSDEHWSTVFNDKRSLQNTKIYNFTPWDGDVNCRVREVRRFGRRMLEIVISELDVHSDPNPQVRDYFRPTVLMRGNRMLETTR